MNYTTNYQLPTWVETDRIQMDDFNDMTDKLDVALAEQSETLAEHTAAIAGLGNCAVYTASYVGNGNYSAVSHTFPGKPMFLMVADAQYGRCFAACRGMPKVYPHYQTNGSIQIDLTWGVEAVSWYYGGDPAWSMNESSATYRILALLDMGA